MSGAHVARADRVGTRTRGARFISHPAFLRPGFGAHHPLSNGRQAAVVKLCEALDWLTPETMREAPLPDVETLSAFHDRGYLAALERVSRDKLATADDRARYHLGTMECPVFDGLWERARASVGGAILAADVALTGTVAFHPAGGTHHGRADRASGFCYLNDPVFAIRRLLNGGLDRVAYVDLDAHHGDGVEAAFQQDQRVALFSIHEAGRWPGTGLDGARDGGRICNVVAPRGVGDNGFQALCDTQLQPWLNRFGGTAVVVTVGADPLAGDPLSSMGISNGTLLDAVDTVIGTARHVVVLGGGGYNPWTTARLWTALWGRLIGQHAPTPLPEAARAVLLSLDSDLVDPEDRPARWYTQLDDPPMLLRKSAMS
jgi:acetoin utilization protein AcuC